MKLKLTKKLLIGMLTCVLMLCAFLAFSNKTPLVSYADLAVNFDSDAVYAEYGLNSEFSIPSAKIIYDGEQYLATNKSLQYPDGKAYSKDSFILNQVGRYTVRYSTVAGGKNLSASVAFTVSDSLYSVSGVNSSAYYGYEEKGGNNAIIVNLSVGDEFIFNKPINFNDNTKINNLLSLYTVGKSPLAKEVKLLRVRFTDILDASNYIEILTVPNPWESDDGNRVTYTGARAYNQDSVGLHLDWKNSATALVFDGVKYNVHRNINVDESKGYPSYGFAFDAKDGYGVKQYKLAMDYAEKKLYGCEPTSPYANGMITDFDEPMIYKELWTGFKSGYAILSISADSYSGSDFNFAITDVDGEDLSSESYVDNQAPIISVELPDGGVSDAIVNTPYGVFPATAVDENDGNVQVSAYAFYGYNTNVRVPIMIENGAFTPKFTGVYDLVYLSTDNAGTVAEKVIKITVKESSALSLTLDEFLNSSVEAGSVVKTPIATVVGNDGKATVSVVATLKDGDICYQLTKSENGYEFAPLYAGEYDIVYTCSDYVSCVTKSLSLTVSASDTPVMVDTPELPLVFVKGCEYTLPTMKGYLLDSGVPVESEMTVSYKFDGGQEVPCDGKMTVNANDYVSVVYTLGSYKKSFDVDVTDVGKDGQIIKKNYFYAPQFTATSDTEKTTYITSTEGATMTFIKPVLVSEFNLKFNIKNKNFEAMNVYLTDTVNIENVLKISLTSSPQGTQFYSVNGGNVQSVTKYLEGTDISLLYYNGEDYVLSGDESLNINGFSGFDSYMANLVIELVGVSGQSEIEIYEINNEVINSYDYDKFDAQYYCDITSGVKRLGDTLNIGRLFVADVLSFESSAYISVYDIDGNACVATDGTVMDKVSNIDREYSITLNGYGEYTVEIRYVDELMQLTSANKSKFKVDYVTVEVVDDVAPQITLGKIINQSGKGKITVATATASDNLDDDVSVYVYVTKPNQVTQKVVDGSFTADTTGVYIVSYYATDSTGNLGFTSYRIEVK